MLHTSDVRSRHSWKMREMTNFKDFADMSARRLDAAGDLLAFDKFVALVGGNNIADQNVPAIDGKDDAPRDDRAGRSIATGRCGGQASAPGDLALDVTLPPSFEAVGAALRVSVGGSGVDGTMPTYAPLAGPANGPLDLEADGCATCAPTNTYTGSASIPDALSHQNRGTAMVTASHSTRPSESGKQRPATRVAGHFESTQKITQKES